MHIISSLNNSSGGCYWLFEVGQEVHGASGATVKTLLDTVPHSRRKRKLAKGAGYRGSAVQQGGP